MLPKKQHCINRDRNSFQFSIDFKSDLSHSPSVLFSPQPPNSSVPMQFTTTRRQTTQKSAAGFTTVLLKTAQLGLATPHVHQIIPPPDTDSTDMAHVLSPSCPLWLYTLPCGLMLRGKLTDHKTWQL